RFFTGSPTFFYGIYFHRNFVEGCMYSGFIRLVSNIGGFHYHVASAIGLLPAQLVNVYLGSSLRSMQDVLEDRSTAATGYVVFCFQILVGVSLMVYIVQKARKELQLTLFEADLASMANSPHYILDGLPDSKIILTNLIA
ncbi:Protein maelstrom, partial [Trachymyrmex cornetzi]